MRFKSIYPYDGSVTDVFEATTAEQLELIIDESHKAFESWKKTSYPERAKLMHAAANELIAQQQKYAESITLEMGKPIGESISEIEKCASVCTYYAHHAESFLADTSLETPHGKGYIHYNPLGVVLAVMPWNFPFWQVFRFAAPALMAGNVCLLKHASNVPKCALEIENIFINAGFPHHIFNTVLIEASMVADILANDKVAAVTLTGSENAGKQVAAAAGSHVKKSVLELGGSDAFIVLDDADLDQAARAGVKSRMLNAGQSCIAAKRFIVENGVFDDFASLFIRYLQQLNYGNPLQKDTDFGPLARIDQAQVLYAQVSKSLEMGAELLFGSLPDKIEDASFPPLIITNLKPGMPAYEEEMFGPVACFFKAEGMHEAVRLANASKYGLGASVWTKNKERANFLSDKIDSGAVYVNQMMFSHPAVPFGGIKLSGYGRELSHIGIREFTNQKTVWHA